MKADFQIHVNMGFCRFILRALIVHDCPVVWYMAIIWNDVVFLKYLHCFLNRGIKLLLNDYFLNAMLQFWIYLISISAYISVRAFSIRYITFAVLVKGNQMITFFMHFYRFLVQIGREDCPGAFCIATTSLLVDLGNRSIYHYLSMHGPIEENG